MNKTLILVVEDDTPVHNLITNNHIGVRPHYCLEILFLFWQF